MIRGGSRSLRQNKDLPLDHPRRIIDFEEAKKCLFNRYHKHLDYQPNSIGFFPIQYGEKPDGTRKRSGLKSYGKDLFMDETPDTLTKRFIIENAEYSLESSSRHWNAWIWRNIVLLAVSGMWPAEHYPYYFNDLWDIFCERKKQWEQIYFVVDANNMPVQSEEFRGYVKRNWSHLVEREDFCLCIVESKAMKRTIWNSIYQLLGVQNRVKMFKDHDRALTWLQSNQITLKEGKKG